MAKINKTNEFTILELAVTYSALNEYVTKLQVVLASTNAIDVKLEGEIELAKSSIQKIKNAYLQKGGDLQYLQ